MGPIAVGGCYRVGKPWVHGSVITKASSLTAHPGSTSLGVPLTILPRKSPVARTSRKIVRSFCFCISSSYVILFVGGLLSEDTVDVFKIGAFRIGVVIAFATILVLGGALWYHSKAPETLNRSRLDSGVSTNWPTFFSTTYNFSVKFPKGWYVVEDAKNYPEGKVEFAEFPPGELNLPRISIFIYENPSELSGEEWLNKAAEEGWFINYANLWEPVLVDGQKGIKTSVFPALRRGLDVYVGYDKRMYSIGLDPYEPEDPEFSKLIPEGTRVFREILRTFRFRK